MTSYVKYVPIHAADDHIRMGWMAVLPGLVGTSHGEWSVLMQWVCGCPVPGGAR